MKSLEHFWRSGIPNFHLNGLVQERHNSIANTLEFRLSCTNPSIYGYRFFEWAAVTWEGWEGARVVIPTLATRWHTLLECDPDFFANQFIKQQWNSWTCALYYSTFSAPLIFYLAKLKTWDRYIFAFHFSYVYFKGYVSMSPMKGNSDTGILSTINWLLQLNQLIDLWISVRKKNLW